MITTAATDFLDRPIVQHEHGWQVESSHTTSIGTVLYVRCACGTRRVDVQGPGDPAPSGISAAIGH